MVHATTLHQTHTTQTPTPTQNIQTVTIDTRDLRGYANIDMYHSGFAHDTFVEDGLVQGYNDDHHTDYTYDDFDWNYDTYATLYDIATFVAERINATHAVETAVVDGVHSPQYYNYTGDWAVLHITYDTYEVTRYCSTHHDEYQKFLADTHWGGTIDGGELEMRHYEADASEAAQRANETNDAHDKWAAGYYKEKAEQAHEEHIDNILCAMLDFYLTHNIPDYTPDDVDYALYETIEEAIYEHTTYTLHDVNNVPAITNDTTNHKGE